jgi:hypothetical protein
MADRVLTRVQGGATDTIHINTDKFAGVRTMSVTAGAAPLTDDTTSIQVTVPNKPEFNGVYNTTAPVTGNSTWTKVGGGVTIFPCNFNETNGYDYAIADSETWGCFDGANGSDRPWKISTVYWTITGLPLTETVTVDRTAQVIDSDRKGESRPLLSKVVGGAAAAYSLRDLNDKAGNNKVVRVRRASDNHERDFLAKEVSNGTLKNWVNTQTVLPLDIQALTDDGRTGSVIPAKAAYSLRNLSKNYTGNVVDVRRSSDDTVQGFTATQVTDGTLLAFVTDAQVGWNEQPNFANAVGTGSVTSQSSTATTATISFTGEASLIREKPAHHFLGSSGDQVILNISVSGLDSAGTLRVRTTNTNTTVGSSSISNGDNQDITLNLTGSAGYFAMTAIASSGGTITFNSIKVLPKTGFVSKWYDQSGNDHHAVQATPANQPVIVSAGALNTSGGLEFDGSNDFFSLTSDISFQNKAGCVFSLQDGQDSSNDFTLGNSDNNRGIGFRNIQTRWYYTTNAIDIDNSSGTSGLTLFTALHDGTTNDPNVTSFVNSSLIVDGIPDANQGEANVSTVANQIGARRDLSFLEGTVKEIIIYDTDQTNNRTAIEANIGEAYSITGIPAYDDTVDGFVETWYDQSGNGSDATQLTAGSQPKIVDAGSLVTGGIDFLDGTDTFLETTNSDICNVPQLSLFTVLTPHIAASQTAAFSCGATVSNSTSYGGWVLTLNGYSDTVGLLTQSKGNSALTGIFTSVTSSEALVSLVSTFPNASISRDGGTAAASSSMVSPNQTSTGTRKFRIGCNFTFRAASFYSQPINEIIVYTSDQTANRPAIEANINNQYDIY